MFDRLGVVFYQFKMNKVNVVWTLISIDEAFELRRTLCFCCEGVCLSETEHNLVSKVLTNY